MNRTLLAGAALAAWLSAHGAMAQMPPAASTSKVTSDPLSLSGPSVKPKEPAKPAETTGQATKADAAKPAAANAASIRLGTDASGRVAINKDQERQLGTALRKANVRPVEGVDVPTKIGAVVPDAVRLGAVSADVVAVLPQFRGYSYFATRDEIVIVEPRGRKIVAFLPVKPMATAARPATERATVRQTRNAVTRVAPGPEIQRDVTVGSGVVDTTPTVVEETTYPAVPGYPAETVRTVEPVVTTGTIVQRPVRQRRVIEVDPD